MTSSAYLFQIPREKSFDYLLIIYKWQILSRFSIVRDKWRQPATSTLLDKNLTCEFKHKNSFTLSKSCMKTEFHSISLFCTDLGLTDMLLTNQNAKIVACILLGMKSYAWFQNRTSAQREFDSKSQVWFQTKIARPEVQLPFYLIHFEIAKLNSPNTRTARLWSVPIFIEPGCQICQTMAFLSFIFLLCDWLV